MTNIKQPYVFINHASEDKRLARQLFERLTADGINAWLDEENLLPGQQWEFEINEAIKNANAIIVCLSSNSLAKEGFVQKELKLALDIASEKPEGTIHIIPARLDESDVPVSLKKYHWANLFDDAGYEKIKKALKIRFNLQEKEDVTSSQHPIYNNSKLAQVTIIIDKDFFKFTDKEKDSFVFAVSKLIGVSSNQIRVLQITEGSVIITLELPEIGAKKLMELYYANNNEIEKLYIRKITINFENGKNHFQKVATNEKTEILQQSEDLHKGDHLQKLMAVHMERLQILELQSAKFGLNAPPHILMEIEDIKKKMSDINSQLKSSGKKTCFISYSSKDQDFARKIYNDLRANNIQVWFAPMDVAIGEHFVSKIDQEIVNRDKTIIILSEQSTKYSAFENEVENALELERKTGKDVLFPIRIDNSVMDSDMEWARQIRRSKSVGDFTNWKKKDNYEKALKRLLRELRDEN